jgi:methionine sulfoxide reductase heme-binding subunit
MSLVMATGSIDWYLTRATGMVALLLLTVAIVLGVIDVKRLSSGRWPRFVVDALHRNVALLAMGFLGLHIVTSVIDSYVSISWLDAVVPFVGSYRPFWLGLGAIAFDLLVAVTVTSMLRRHMGYASWRAVHWLTYASWPIALVHGFGTGSDVHSLWLTGLSVTCLLAVLATVVVRVADGWPDHLRRRGAALAGAALFALFLAIWLPAGPLGSEWARRSGTPTTLIDQGNANAKQGTER